MENNAIKIEHPYSIKEFILKENNQDYTMFVVDLQKSNVNIDWIESTWRSDLNLFGEIKSEMLEMYYSKSSYLDLENDRPIMTFSFEDIEQAEYHEFDVVILVCGPVQSPKNISSFSIRIAKMIAEEILSVYVHKYQEGK